MVTIVLFHFYQLALYLVLSSALDRIAGIYKINLFAGLSIEWRIATGFVVVSALCQVYALFRPVDTFAHCAIAGISLVAIGDRHVRSEIAHFLRDFKLRSTRAWIVAAFAALLVLLNCSSSVYFDSGLYHWQIITWLNGFAAVPGLANLHDRLGFNSTFHIISAFFNPLLTGGENACVTNSFLGILFLSLVLRQLESGQKHAVMGYIICFVMFAFWRTHFSSPITDFPANVFYALSFMLFIHTYENRQEGSLVLQLLFCSYAITVKFSCLPIALTSFVLLIRTYKHITGSALLLAFSAILLLFTPYLARNYIQTGYLVYPSVFPDLFAPDWKIPLEHVQVTKNMVTSFAFTGWYDMDFDLGEHEFTSLLASWFGHQIAESKIIFAVLFLFVTLALVTLPIKLALRRKLPATNHLTFFLVTLLNLLVWAIISPSFRFSVSLLLTALYCSILLVAPQPIYKMEKLASKWLPLLFVPLFVYVSVPAIRFISEKKDASQILGVLIKPEPPMQMESYYTVFAGENRLVISTDGDFKNQCWAERRPCTYYINPGLEFRGASPENGFRINTSSSKKFAPLWRTH